MTPCARRRLAFDLAAALDAALDQIAHREAHIGLVGVDACRVQPIANGRNIAGLPGFDSATRLPANVRLSIGCGWRHAQRARALDIRGANIEMRTLTIVAHEECAAVFEPADRLDDGNAPPSGRFERDSSLGE